MAGCPGPASCTPLWEEPANLPRLQRLLVVPGAPQLGALQTFGVSPSF